MGKLCNIIFYLEKWGSQHVIQKEHEIEHIPNVNEMVVIERDNQYAFYHIEERVFDYADNIVHIRVDFSPRCYDLAIM